MSSVPTHLPFFPQLDRLLQRPGLGGTTGGPNALVLLGPRAPRRMELVGGRAGRREEAGLAGVEGRLGGLPADSTFPSKFPAPRGRITWLPGRRRKGVSRGAAPPSGRPLHALLPPARGARSAGAALQPVGAAEVPP